MNNPVAPQSKSQPKRILIVENDEDLINVYQTRLRVEGFEVAVHPTGKNVLAKVIAYQPDLIILDIMLPFMNGLDALEQIRANPISKNIKVIVVSALSIESERKKAEKLGVTEYLVKSKIILADLVEHIKEQLGMVMPLEEEVFEDTTPS